MVYLSPEFVFERLVKCVRDVPNVAKGSDSHEMCARKVSSSEKRGTIKRCCLWEPCPGAVEYTLEQGAPEVDFIVKVGLMEYGVPTELNPMEVSNVVKFHTPETDTFVEDSTMKVGASLEDSLTEPRGPMKNGFIEINVRLKERTPKIDIFFEDYCPKINDVSKCTPDARDILVEKDLVVVAAF